MKRALAALVLLGAVAQAQTGHAGHSVGSVSTGVSMPAMSKQMVSALGPLRGRAFDIKFAQLMMDHHQMALDMAGQELSSGKNAQVRAAAKKVVAAQQQEIALMTGWLRKWTGKVYVPQTLPMAMTGDVNPDRWFLTEMIPHHQGAVDMSKTVLNTVKDTQVKRWTADIIGVQQKEIGEMNTWLKTLGGVDRSVQAGMNMEMKTMITALKANKDSDRGLVEGMLPHHASAIDMASLALQKSSDSRVLGLARDIIRSQADEMYAYRQWLIKRGF